MDLKVIDPWYIDPMMIPCHCESPQWMLLRQNPKRDSHLNPWVQYLPHGTLVCATAIRWVEQRCPGDIWQLDIDIVLRVLVQSRSLFSDLILAIIKKKQNFCISISWVKIIYKTLFISLPPNSCFRLENVHVIKPNHKHGTDIKQHTWSSKIYSLQWNKAQKCWE